MARRRRKDKRSHSAFDDFAPEEEGAGGRNVDRRTDYERPGRVKPLYQICPYSTCSGDCEHARL